jgi:cytochrome c-type biogenesis protein CcmH
MLFWVVAALLTLGACLAVLVPLSRARVAAVDDGRHDIEVYRDQLAEVERDASRGLIGEAEAREARAEIGRRILRAADAGSEAAPSRTATRAIGMVGVLCLPLVAWGVYAVTGSPDLPGQPLQARLEKNPGESTIEELVARAEAHLRENPTDARGWDVLAPIYLRLGRPADSVTAYRNGLRLAGPTAAREAGLGEALAADAGGVVTEDAREAFERALALDPAEPRSRYFLATARAQEGDHAGAAREWRALLAALPADSRWREPAERAARQAEQQAEEGAAAAPATQDAMIRDMVASLDERLRREPQDAEGWKRLVRSYVVLGQENTARDALERGVEALGPDSEPGRDLVSFAGTLGVTIGAAP